MPKGKVERGGKDWRDEPATDGQIMRLLMLLKESEVIEVERHSDIEEYEPEAVEWANGFLARDVNCLSQLTKGEIGMLFSKLE